MNVCADFHELQHALRCLPQHAVGAGVWSEQGHRPPLQMPAAAPPAATHVYAFTPSERVARAASGSAYAAHHSRANIGSEGAVRTNS